MCALDGSLDEFICESTSIEFDCRLRGADLLGEKTSDGTSGLFREFTSTGSSGRAYRAASSSLAIGRATELRVPFILVSLSKLKSVPANVGAADQYLMSDRRLC